MQDRAGKHTRTDCKGVRGRRAGAATPAKYGAHAPRHAHKEQARTQANDTHTHTHTHSKLVEDERASDWCDRALTKKFYEGT